MHPPSPSHLHPHFPHFPHPRPAEQARRRASKQAEDALTHLGMWPSRVSAWRMCKSKQRVVLRHGVVSGPPGNFINSSNESSASSLVAPPPPPSPQPHKPPPGCLPLLHAALQHPCRSHLRPCSSFPNLNLQCRLRGNRSSA